MQDTNRERNILLIAKFRIALDNWYGEYNVNSCKDRDSEQVKWLIHLTKMVKGIRMRAQFSPFVVNKSLGLQ
jgi:hypothetical protein